METKTTHKTFTASIDTTPRQTGTVKWFDKVRGYGFIIPDDGSAEVFVHYSAIEGDGYRNLYQDDRVTYDLVERGKGPQAQNVQARGGAA